MILVDGDRYYIRSLASCIVSVICFAWFIIALDDLFPLAACVVMACKSIFELSWRGTEFSATNKG